jgi:hypothetical protein
MRDIGKRIPGEQIGEGAYKRAFESSDPESVIVEFKHERSNAAIKSAYYLNHIMWALFPENFPRVRWAANIPIESDKMLARMLVEKIPHTARHVAAQTDEPDLANAITVSPKYLALKRQLKNAGLEKFGIIWGEQDVVERNGALVLVDLEPGWDIDDYREPLDVSPPKHDSTIAYFLGLKFKPFVLMRAIDSMQDGEREKHARVCFRRLIALAREEGFKYLPRE